MFYQDYHTHPINKLIHIFCIPCIVLTSCNLLSLIRFKISTIDIELPEFLILILSFVYLKKSILQFFVMTIYYFAILTFSYIWRERKNYIRESIIVFISSWILQFIGHLIEGNRPALFDSILSTFIEAPVFSLSYILPFNII